MKCLGEMRETTLTIAEEVDLLRYGFWIIIADFVLVAFINMVSTFRWTEVTSVATVIGAVASLVGTVVGAFFGVQVGGCGQGEGGGLARASGRDGSGRIVHVTARVCSTAKI
jgi:predicted membrane channel-forming protein YqfA (hemolysin III family)